MFWSLFSIVLQSCNHVLLGIIQQGCCFACFAQEPRRCAAAADSPVHASLCPPSLQCFTCTHVGSGSEAGSCSAADRACQEQAPPASVAYLRHAAVLQPMPGAAHPFIVKTAGKELSHPALGITSTAHLAVARAVGHLQHKGQTCSTGCCHCCALSSHAGAGMPAWAAARCKSDHAAVHQLSMHTAAFSCATAGQPCTIGLTHDWSPACKRRSASGAWPGCRTEHSGAAGRQQQEAHLREDSVHTTLTLKAFRLHCKGLLLDGAVLRYKKACICCPAAAVAQAFACRRAGAQPAGGGGPAACLLCLACLLRLFRHSPRPGSLPLLRYSESTASACLRRC